MNGDLGTMVDIDFTEKRIKIAVDGEHYMMSFTQATSDMTLAYAMTIHKAQGGEFPCVIMIMHPSHHMMLMRNLLYTGITRASRCLILITTPGATERAVRNNVIEKRNSGLVERLNGTKGEGS
jgi:exodeoxyribonuclease V alpha subunit